MNIELNISQFIRGTLIATVAMIGLEAMLYGALTVGTSVEQHAAQARIAAIVAEG